MISQVFIDRPRLAIVISIVTVLLGGLCLLKAPVAEYPEIAPPSLVVLATYTGAGSEEVADTVATVSVVMDGEYGVSDVALSTLCVIGKEGVITTLTPKLSADEEDKFRRSAEVLKGVISQIEI